MQQICANAPLCHCVPTLPFFSFHPPCTNSEPEVPDIWHRGCYGVENFKTAVSRSWPGSSVGIATGYVLDGPGIESQWRRNFPHLSRPALGLTQPPVQRVPGLSRGKERSGCDADPSPLSSAVDKKEYSYTSTPPMGLTACTELQCLYKGAL